MRGNSVFCSAGDIIAVCGNDLIGVCDEGIGYIGKYLILFFGALDAKLARGDLCLFANFKYCVLYVHFLFVPPGSVLYEYLFYFKYIKTVEIVRGVVL